jgi:predicted component of type VI protein secretion system
LANTVSEYFTDEDLESNLRLEFEYEEMFDMDFRTVFNQIEDMGEFLQLRLRGRVFQIDKITGGVNEVEL